MNFLFVILAIVGLISGVYLPLIVATLTLPLLVVGQATGKKGEVKLHCFVGLSIMLYGAYCSFRGSMYSTKSCSPDR